MISSSQIYFSGSHSLELSTPVDITNGFSLQFRTCSGGIILEQIGNSSQLIIRLSLEPSTLSSHSQLILSWSDLNLTHHSILKTFYSLDRNKLIKIQFTVERPSSILSVSGPINANVSVDNSILNTSNSGHVYFGGGNFTGCMYEGKNVNFSAAVNKEIFGTSCPLEDQRPCTNRGMNRILILYSLCLTL